MSSKGCNALKTFWHIDVWLEPVPHWFVPLCPFSVVFGAVLGKYVALYVWAPTKSGRATMDATVASMSGRLTEGEKAEEGAGAIGLGR